MDVELGPRVAPKQPPKTVVVIMDKDEFRTFKVVVFYSSLVVCVPIAAFFLFKFCMLDILFSGLSTAKGDILSVIAAVASLHFGLGVFIYRAFFYVRSGDEGDTDGATKLQDKLE